MSQLYSPKTSDRSPLHSVSSVKQWRGAIATLAFLILVNGCTNQPQGAITPSPTPSIAAPIATPTATTAPNASKSQATKDLEGRLTQAFTNETKVPLNTVDCPAQFDVKAGNRFNCQATSDGQSFTIAVELTKPDGQFQWRTNGLLLLSKLEQFIQKRVRDKGGPDVVADCGGKIRVAQPGDTFACKVTSAQAQSRSAQVKVKDEQGGVDISLR